MRVFRRSIALLAAVSAVVLASLPATTSATGAEAAPAAPSCEDLIALDAGGSTWCTHGGDHVHGVDHDHGESAGAIGPIARFIEAPRAPCPGDGVGGRRIVVYYGFPAGTENRVATFRPQIRGAVGFADANLDAATPGLDGQHYRFYCENDRGVTVKPLKLLPIGGDGAYTFVDLMTSLYSRVLNGLGPKDLERPKHVYSVFVDNLGGAYPYGGQGTMAGDDGADPATNWNNLVAPGFARYSMVKLGWDTITEAGLWQHEIGHNLGAVQGSAPHSSGAGHCVEEWDVMCYADGGPYFTGGGTILSVCTSTMPDGQEPWDCGADDYYAADPADGSYLDAHWNLVDSGWLSWSP